MASTQGYVPESVPLEPPRFFARPAESLRTVARLTKLLLWPYGLVYIGLAVVVRHYFTPSLGRMHDIQVRPVAEIYVRNLVIVAVWVSAIHLWLYVRRWQGMRFKYDRQWLITHDARFMDRDQTRENAFWTLVSAPVFWTAWEVYLYGAYARNLIPHVRWSDGAGWVIYLVVMTVFSFWLVAGYFYVTHRFLHTRLMYRRVHYLHHKNVNTGPWSGLSMHPVEHLLYFSTPVFFLFIPANPFIIIVTQIFTGLAPSLGHSNFDRIVVAGDRTLPAGDYFHDLHHKYFECNYGTPVVPVDAWAGTWHDGSPEAHERMRARRDAAGHTSD
ncbi:MAG: sterol desaturase family protein [bacterium]|nr:sterol desaturase family protein [bacterium]